MSKRPSATNNDPGYLYNQKRLLQIFAVSSLFLGAMITWMIWDDFDRPWKDEQRAQFLWEAERMRLEMGILDQRTQELRAKLGAAEERGQAEIDRLASDLLGISDELATARGTYTGALMNYNAQRQFTSEASFNSGNARTPDERDTWKLRHKEEVDKEARLYANLQSATDNMDRLVDAEKEILGAIARQTDEAIRKNSESELENEDAEDQGPEAIARRVAMRRKELSRIQLLERGIEQKQGYNFLREIPLTDFLAPPTKVEQVVLDYVTDDYTFAAPKKVDRCGTCHIATIQPGFEHARFPVEIFDMRAGPAKIKMFEEGVYRFVNGIIDGVWPAVSKTSKFSHEEGRLRDLEVNHETLRILFVEYDSE